MATTMEKQKPLLLLKRVEKRERCSVTRNKRGGELPLAHADRERTTQNMRRQRDRQEEEETNSAVFSKIMMAHWPLRDRENQTARQTDKQANKQRETGVETDRTERGNQLGSLLEDHDGALTLAVRDHNQIRLLIQLYILGAAVSERTRERESERDME
jgi:hypothetical protein